MIPQALDTNQVTTNMDEAHKIRMRLDPDEESLIQLQDLLTNLYTDPKRAVVRELSNNGWDSHVEAGVKRPIEVTTPSSFAPTFTVKDFGVGANEDDIRDIWALFGKSTKRKTNEQTGSLGVGGKSPLTYTSQFMVVGIKDGVRTVVNVAKDEDGGSSMTIIESGPTDEGNGVEIKVPVERGDEREFQAKAKDFFQYWAPGTVLLDGEEPTPLTGLRVADHIFFAEKSEDWSQARTEEDVIIMGSVPYEIPAEVSPVSGLLEGHRLVAYLPMGDVHFTPSREGLKLTKKTRARLELLTEEITAALETAVQADIDAATNPQDAMTKAIAWRGVFNTRAHPGLKEALANLKYKGEVIPQSIKSAVVSEDAEGVATHEPITVARADADKPGQHETRKSSVAVNTLVKAVVIYGYEVEKFTAGHKKKLIAYAEAQGLSPEYYVLTKSPLNVQWIDSSHVAQWEQHIKPIKIKRETAESRGWKITGSYPAWMPGCTYQKEVEATDIDTNAAILYYDKTTFESYGYRAQEDQERYEKYAVGIAREFFPGCTVVRLGLNRIEKFNRDFPNAEPITTAVQRAVNGVYDATSPHLLTAWRLQDKDECRLLRRLPADQIRDPELRAAIQAASLKVSDDANIRILADFRSNLVAHRFETKLRGFGEIETYDLEADYPLLDDIGYDAHKHVGHLVLYVNAVYDHNQITAALYPERKAA